MNGFLPVVDPRQSLPSNLAVLDEIGRDLPSLLEDTAFRQYAKELEIPPLDTEDTHVARLYYVRLGFLASGYINQLGVPSEHILPANIAIPLCSVAKLLGKPPILSYDGYALYNWKRFNSSRPVALGNIDTLQNFVHLYDEHWFILIHVEIEAIAAECVDAILKVHGNQNEETINEALKIIASSVWKQVAVLRRIPEKMAPHLYYKTFRQYIRFFENVIYEGVSHDSLNYRGETGAQSSVLPALVSFLKIPHKPSALTNHLADMRNFMPSEHQTVLNGIESMPSIKEFADKDLFNEVLEAIASFREIHIGWAQDYINKWVSDNRGTGGTPYMEWLNQLISETRNYKIG
jgi:indoleamine 2,3-dioxygenase